MSLPDEDAGYRQHRAHMRDGTYPWPDCPYCQAWIIQPARREVRGDNRPTGVTFITFPDDDDLADVAELADEAELPPALSDAA